MIRSVCRFGLAMVVCGAALSAPQGAFAQGYSEVKTQSQLNLGDPDLTLQRSIVTFNDIIYALNANFSPADFNLVKIDGATSTELATLTSTVTDLGAAFPPNDPFPGFGMAVVDSGAAVQLIDSANNQVYRFNTTTGTASLYVSQANIQAETGITADPADISTISGVSSTGAPVFLETESGSILTAPSAGVVDTLVTNAQLVAANAEPDSGITMDDSGNYYWGSNDSDTVFKFDGNNVIALLTAADFGGTTNGFNGDFFFAPDGLIYLRADPNSANRGIFSFDPAAVDPASTLVNVLSEDQLVAGPAGTSFVTEFSWFDGNLGFHSISNSGYYVVPEPGVGGLMAMGGLMALIRRRRSGR